MKKRLISCLLILTTICPCVLRADSAAIDTDEQMEEATSLQATLPPEPQEEPLLDAKPVSKAPEGGNHPGRKRLWQNIGLAIGAVAIAVTALILVGQNDGHHHGHND